MASLLFIRVFAKDIFIVTKPHMPLRKGGRGLKVLLRDIIKMPEPRPIKIINIMLRTREGDLSEGLRNFLSKRNPKVTAHQDKVRIGKVNAPLSFFDEVLSLAGLMRERADREA